MADVGGLVGDVVAALDALAAADPGVLGDGETLVVLHAQRERLSAVLTRAVGRFDAGGEWAADGARSSAAWLSARCRMPMVAARRQVRLGREVRALAAGEAAWVAGSIGEAQVSLLASARVVAPGEFGRDEAMLVQEAGRLRYHHFARVVAYWRQLAAAEVVEDEAARDHDARRAHLSGGLRGTGFLDAQFDPIGFAIFEQALRVIEEELFEADWAEARARVGHAVVVSDVRRTPAQRRHDALVEMARRAQAVPAGGRVPDPLFTVLVDYDTFAGRVCELANATVVTPGSLVPWLAEAQIERAVFGGADRSINIGTRRRLFTGATRRAIEVRDRECFHELCDVPAPQCEIDHIEPYSAGGLTTDTNGRCACPFHNRQRHRREGREEEEPPDRPP